MNPARAMIWKELHENLRWTLLGMLAMSCGLFYVLWQHGTRWFGDYGYATRGSPLLTEEFQAVTVVGAGVVGLLLAVAQVLPEKRRDQWAFLVHRPVSRTRLLLCKVAAGLMLYTLAVVVPVAAAVAWVATPGHVPAPFVAGMALPALADVLMGVAYYFAGLVIAMREARWYATRLLSAGVTVAASFPAFLLPEFSWALLAIVVAIAVSATAAWGGFLTGGHYARQPWPARLALGVCLFHGIAMLGGVGVAALAGALPRQYGISEWTYEALIDDGRVIRFRQAGEQVVSATDLAGKPAPETLDEVRAARENRTGDVGLGLSPSDNRRWQDGWYRSESRFYEALDAPAYENWYYLHERGYGVGYGTRKSNLIGTFGPGGFSAPNDVTPPARRFEGRTAWLRSYDHYAHAGSGRRLTFRSGVYELDFDRRKVIAAFVPPAGDRVVAVALGGDDAEHAHSRGRAPKQTFEAFATTKQVTVREPGGRALFTVGLEHGPADGFDSVVVARRGDGEDAGRYFLWYKPGYRRGDWGARPSHLVELTSAGAVVTRTEVPPIRDNEYKPGSVRFEQVLTAAAAPSLVTIWENLTAWRYTGSEFFRAWMAEPTSRAAALAALLSGLASAAATVLLARRLHASPRRRRAWAVANFFLGPAGVLTMSCLSAWPVFEPCPACGRRRAVNREQCPNCAAPFSPPALDGTEIFAT
jgi:hypothetical protein